MTGIDPRATRFAPVILGVLLFLSGCAGEATPFPLPGDANEAAMVMRRTSQGPVLVIFSASPLRSDTPPDGIREAVARAIGGIDCSAAAFHWNERPLAERWLGQELTTRRSAGFPERLILAGHGVGATAAAETAAMVMASRPETVITLLLTVDAVKTGWLGSAAGVTGAALAKGLARVRVNYTAFDGAPPPDGRRLLRHINYYQNRGELYHGSPMPGAENHLLHDDTGLLNHGDIDDFALPLLERDIRSALPRSPGGR
ncbi:MAG: hypothetical protein LBU79_00995 [Planctomycetota bacterium]|jgi:hypothetical protein|nr:hypothetical protein [Planctomycetota bacterium]